MGSIIMKCPIEIHGNQELLVAYSAHKLDPQTEANVERHLAACPECREFHAGQDALWQALDAWEAVPVSADFNRRLYRRIEDETRRESWWSRLVWAFRPLVGGSLISRGVPLAAAACLLVLAGVILDRANVVIVPEDYAERIESIQPDQVESTLDDMEMLRQFRITPVNDAGTVNSM
jgi:anti-sigma factor RsiW